MESMNNSEVLITTAINVAVLTYDLGSKSWAEAHPLNGSPVEEDFIPSSVYLLNDQVYGNARIVARKQTPKQEVLVNCPIGPGLQFKRPTPRFFEWRDSRSSTIFGLNFFSEADAEQFVVHMQTVIGKAARLKKEPQTAPCGSLDNIKCSKFETIPPPGKVQVCNQPIYHKIQPLADVKRDSCERSPIPSLILNPDVQARPLPPVPANDGTTSPTIRQNSLTRATKKAPPPPSAKVIISCSRPKTLLPNSQVSPLPYQDVCPLSRSSGTVPPPPPPAPPPPPPVTSVPYKSPSTFPGAKTKRSQSVGLLDGISAVQLRKLEQSPVECTSSKDGNYVDMMSEIAERIKRRKEKQNGEASGDSTVQEFKTYNRPSSATKSKIPPPSQNAGRPLKKGPQQSESFNSGTLPSVAEGTVGQGHELLLEKMEALRADMDKLKGDIYGRLDRFKEEIITALKVELARR